MTQPRFSKLHLFVDETGKLTTERDRLNAVGGVLFFGRYDSGVDTELKDILQTRFEEADGRFPTDLHYSQGDLSHGQLRHCLQRVGGDLQKLLDARPLQEIYGVSITHEMSIIAHTGHLLLDEDKRDNRYRELIWSLIEHLVFADPRVRKRLATDWTLHLHVASRTIPLKRSQSAERLQLEKAGYDVQGIVDGRHARQGEKPESYRVYNTLTARDLEQILRDGQRLRWSDRPVKLGTVNVDKLNYQHTSSPAGLYLADLYLGQFRASELRSEEITILEPFADLRYGPWMETIAEMAVATLQENVDHYLRLREKFDSYDHEAAGSFNPLVSHFDEQIAPLLQQNPRRLEQELVNASEQVDQPGQTTQGFRQAERAYQFLENADAVTDRARLLYLQTALSHANHTGDTVEADRIWAQSEELLDNTGHELFRLNAEIRNRRAVALTDQFRHEEAHQVLIPLIEQQEQIADITGDRGLSHAIGACYGTLGQVEAFTDHLQSAESFFLQALSHFKDPADRERQWIYLGHVGCQMGDSPGKQLCSKALQKIMSLRGDDDPVSSGSQYILALYLKSCLVFSSPEAMRAELHAWNEKGILDNFNDEDRAHHPFGLIYQTLAMCHERLIRCDLDVDIDEHLERARSEYDRAIDQMNTGGSLLQLLGIAAELRRELLNTYIASRHNTSPEHCALGRTFQRFRSHIQSHFGPPAWGEREDGTPTGYFGQYDPGPGNWVERSKSVLQAIRFNYW